MSKNSLTLKHSIFILISFFLSTTLISQKKQNILFIGVDDMRPLINSYGYPQMKTPNLDKLASEGVQFNQAYTNIAVCGASRASILTGVRGSKSRFVKYYTRADEDLPKAITLAKLFKQNGYTTGSIGKIYHEWRDNFDEWDIYRNFREQRDYQSKKTLRMIEKRKERNPNNPNNFIGPAWEYADVEDDAYTDGKLTDFAIKTLGDFKDSKKPFFLAVGYVSPHLPFIQPKKYGEMYDDSDLTISREKTIPKNAHSRSYHNWDELRNGYLDIPKKGPVSLNTEKELIKSYYASVSYLDALVGKLIKSLNDLGLRDNTTIVFWSDHGFFLGEHGFWCKHHTFQEAIHVPLIISAPNMTKNEKTDALVEYVDIYPTLSELAGIEAPDYIHGESLVPILKNPSQKFKSEIYSRYQMREVVQDLDYSYHEIIGYDKYFKDRNGNNTPSPDSNERVVAKMLFDMRTDKLQSIDISNEPRYKEVVEKYSKKLLNMRKITNKPILIK